MLVMQASEARKQWVATMEQAQREPLLLTSHGRKTVMMMDAAHGERALEALEELEDLHAAEEALKEPGESVSLEQVAAELEISLG